MWVSKKYLNEILQKEAESLNGCLITLAEEIKKHGRSIGELKGKITELTTKTGDFPRDSVVEFMEKRLEDLKSVIGVLVKAIPETKINIEQKVDPKKGMVRGSELDS